MDRIEECDVSLRSKLERFLQARLERRLEVQKDEDKRAALIERFRFEIWFEYAAKKVVKLQAATHVSKFSHPSIKKASDIYSIPLEKGSGDLVGTHSIGQKRFQHDLSAGNAADLDGDLKEFLRIEHGGKTIFDKIVEQDSELSSAISSDVEKAKYVMRELLSLTRTKNPKRSHTLSKQIFWMVGDDPSLNGSFYLLSPILASSLAHAVFSAISESRFGSLAKEARNFRQKGKFFDGGYHDYTNLAVQKMGGSNQQNVSQLNSERGGQNYLLASLPPNWQSRSVYAPMTEAMRSFQSRPEVRRILADLKNFLETDPAKNMHTRDLRDDLTAMLVDELMLFTVEIHSIPPGWTADERCRLSPDEQFWLDPGRAEIDEEFAAARHRSEWSNGISARAANWLNGRLSYERALKLGDNEHEHWKREVGFSLENFQHQLDDLQDALRDEDEGGEAA